MMKKHLTKLMTACLAIALSACDKVDMAEENAGNGIASLRISTRSDANSDVSYPINIYVFKGNEQESAATITESGGSTDLSLDQGSYTVSAISGQLDFINGSSGKPLLIGKEDVKLASGTTEVAIALQYQVAKVSFCIENVPENVSAVSIDFGRQYNAISKLAVPSGSSYVTKEAKKADASTWKTEEFYTLPGAGTKTEITISFTIDGKQAPYKLIYEKPLVAGTPYNFTCSYMEGSGTEPVTPDTPSDPDEPSIPIDMDKATLRVSISFSDWNKIESETLHFGPGFDATDTQNILVDALPTTPSVWQNHIIATCDENGNALIFSLKEWSDVATVNSGTPEQAVEIAKVYSENGLTGWGVPTTEEATLLKEYYGTEADRKPLHDLLKSLGADDFTDGLDGLPTYLCNEGKGKFTLARKNSISNIAASDKSKYHLRLVHRAHFSIK